MIPKKALEVVDQTLRDICYSNTPLGDKLIVWGGDFRQILPVLKHGYRNSIVEDTIKISPLWPLFKVLNLTQNIRSNNKTFASFVLELGEGKINPFMIPNEWKTENVCNKIYDIINLVNSIDRVILAPHNDDTKLINNKVLSLWYGNTHTYYSWDYAPHKGVDQTDENILLNYPVEMLNNIREGLPRQELKLKINAIVMLIRNISITEGMCNARLKITGLFNHNIKAKIITCERIGEEVPIPRITLNTGDSSSFPFTLFRKQFSIVLAFAITINKSQGQSFNSLGIFIRRSLFLHGQLYVALSWCKNPNNIFIENLLENSLIIDNIVWKEIFDIYLYLYLLNQSNSTNELQKT